MQCKPNTYASTGHHLFVNDRVNRCNINYNRCCPTGRDQQYCTKKFANNKDFFDISNRRSNIKDMLKRETKGDSTRLERTFFVESPEDTGFSYDV